MVEVVLVKSSDATVTRLLKQIRQHHVHARRKVARYFRKPLPDAEIFAICHRLGHDFPEDWLTLYQTFDGVDPGDSISLWASTVFLEWTWLDLRLVEEVSRGQKETGIAGADHNVYFALSFTDTPDLALDFSRRVGEVVPIVATSLATSSDSVIFDDVLSMLRTVEAVHEAGLVSYSGGQTVKYDKRAVATIATAYNQRAAFWRRWL